MGSDSEISANEVRIDFKRYACPYEDCLAAYNRPSKLARHIRSHTKERPFKCDYPDCKKDYISNAHLKRHIMVSHMKTNVPIVYLSCPHVGCLKLFKNKYSLKRHSKSHNENQYSCPECNQRFKKKRHLVWHYNQHKGFAQFNCNHCNEKFRTKKMLASHEKRHRIYVCEYMECKEEFTTWSLLQKHFKIKHKRLYECDFCKRTFINKNTMMKHVLTHLDMPSPDVYPCPYNECSRYYKYKKNLTQHIKTSHEGKQYECTEEDCKQVFKSKNRLKDHLTRHKNGTLNIPRVLDRTKPRRPRKDKGMPTKSMAALLSGVVLPPKVDKCLAHNIMTSEVEESINCTIELLKEVPEEEPEVEESATTTDVDTKDPSCSIMYIVNKRPRKCFK